MVDIMQSFKDPQAVARYLDGPPRFLPGMSDMHKMTSVLLAERVPADGTILTLGAGGGLELRAFATAFPHWQFTGVDPSAEMLDLAASTLGAMQTRVQMIEGYIDAAPEGPYDAATCLLTLHFLEAAERQRTAAEVRRRLKPGAPFVVVHSSFPQGPSQRPLWLKRYARFAEASGVSEADAENARAMVDAHLDIYEPARDEAILRDAGFSDVQMFYAAFTWRGWVGYA